MGGVMLARSPYIPSAISFDMLGTSAARSSNRSWGVPQSRPITATRGPCCMRRHPSSFVAPARSCAGRALETMAGRAGTRGGSTVLVCYQPARNADRGPPGDAPSMTVLRRALGLGAVLLLVLAVPLVALPRTIVERIL